jgi:hypothetical protein
MEVRPMNYADMTKHQLITLDKDNHFKKGFSYRPSVNEVYVILSVSNKKVFGYYQYLSTGRVSKYSEKKYFHVVHHEVHGRVRFMHESEVLYVDEFEPVKLLEA